MLGAGAAIRRARMALLALALATAKAGAAELDYRAPAECPARDELSFRIQRGLGSPLEQAPAVHFDVEVHRTGTAYVATLQLREAAVGPERERKLEARTCAELLDALSVAVVLAIGALEAKRDGSLEPAPDEREPGAAAPTAPAAESPHEPAAEPPGADAQPAESGAARALRPGAFLLLLGDVGSLPSPAVGLSLGGGLLLGGWRLRGALNVFLEQHVDLRATAAAAPGADLDLFFGVLSGCYRMLGKPDSGGALAACVGVEVGQLSGQGTRVRNGQPRQALWLAAAGSLEGSWPITRNLSADAQIGVSFPLDRSEFVLGDAGRVHRPAQLAGRGALGLSWDWE